MLIICPHCSTQHNVPDDYIGETGRKVRCSGCREIWLAQRPESAESASERAETPTETAETEAETAFPVENSFDAPPAAGNAPTASKIDARRARGKAGKARPTSANSPGKRALDNWPTITIAASLCLLFALVGMRDRVVRIAPQMARLYAAAGLSVNLRGLNLDNVATKLFTEGDAKLLIVAGDVTNPTGHPIALPPLRFALRNDKGVEVYSWTARLDQSELGPGEVLPFKRRLAAPPAEGRDVQVRFLSGTDLASLGGIELKPAEPKPAAPKPAEASH